MSAVEDIRIKLEQRLNDLEHEIESLRSALTALDDEEAARRSAEAPTAVSPTPRKARKAPAAAGARKSAGGPRRRSSAQPHGNGDGRASAELEQLLAETGGLTAVELARQTGTDPAAVLARIRQLEQAGRSRS
jgi:TolA-binding protein